MFSEYSAYIIAKLIVSIPLFIVLFIGVFFCARHARRQPRVVVLTGLALLAAVIDLVFGDGMVLQLILAGLAESPMFESYIEQLSEMNEIIIYLILFGLPVIPKTIAWSFILWVIFKTYPQQLRQQR